MSIEAVRSFLLRALLIEDEKHGPCVRVSLAHGKSSGAATRLHAWAIGEAERSTAAANTLASELYRVAQDHAGAFDGVQRFALGAFYGDEIEPGRTAAIRLTVSEERGTSSAAEPTEEASPRGLLSQVMRHNEAITRLGHAAVELSLRNLQAQNASLAAENSELRQRNHDSIMAVERAVSEQHRRDLEDRKFAAKARIQAELIGKVNVLLPVVVNRLMGQAALPAGPGADRLRALVGSISREQIASMASALSVEQQIAFFDVVKDYLPDAADPATH